MKITDVQAILISIPLKKPTSMSNKTVTAREYVVTRVHTDEGITGSAYTLGGPVVLTAVNETLKPLAMGADPFDTERLWDKRNRQSIRHGSGRGFDMARGHNGFRAANFLFTVVEETNKSAWKFNSPTGGGYPLNFLVILIAR